MRLRTTRMTFRLPIVVTAAMVVLALVGTAAVASASNTVDKDVAQTTIGRTTEPDTIREAGTAAPRLAGFQMMDDDHDGSWNSGWWIVMAVMMVIFWGSVIAVAVWGYRRSRETETPAGARWTSRRSAWPGVRSGREFDRIRGDLE